MKAKLVNEKLGLGKIGRKLDWGLSADTRSPREFASEIKELPDETLLKWYDDFVPYNPSSQAKFQQRLVKLELEKRGLLNEAVTPGTKDVLTVEDASYDIALYALHQFPKDNDMRKFRNHIEKVISEYAENLESLDDSGWYEE